MHPLVDLIDEEDALDLAERTVTRRGLEAREEVAEPREEATNAVRQGAGRQRYPALGKEDALAAPLAQELHVVRQQGVHDVGGFTLSVRCVEPALQCCKADRIVEDVHVHGRARLQFRHGSVRAVGGDESRLRWCPDKLERAWLGSADRES